MECKYQQAWQLLSSLQLSSRSYSKPGKSIPLTKNVNASISGGSRQTTQLFQSDLKSMAAGRDQNHKSLSKGDVLVGGPSKSLNSCYTANTVEVKESRQFPTMQNGSHSVHHTAIRSTTQTSTGNDPRSSFAVDMDDDDILEVVHSVAYSISMFMIKFVLTRIDKNLSFQDIDVDQIVLNHYQSTPQPSLSKIPPITPLTVKNNYPNDEISLPPELCLICSHGCKVLFNFTYQQFTIQIYYQILILDFVGADRSVL